MLIEMIIKPNQYALKAKQIEDMMRIVKTQDLVENMILYAKWTAIQTNPFSIMEWVLKTIEMAQNHPINNKKHSNVYFDAYYRDEAVPQTKGNACLPSLTNKCFPSLRKEHEFIPRESDEQFKARCEHYDKTKDPHLEKLIEKLQENFSKNYKRPKPL